MRTKLFATSALLALTAFGAARAAETTEVSELVINTHLEESQPAALARTGVRVDVIPGQAIRDSGFVDITEALQSAAPGLTVISKSGPFDYVDISYQGSRTQDVLWLVDGVRINNRLYATTTPLDTVPAAMVDRVEILNGGQSLFYGTQGMAGAVNIVTREFSDTRKAAITLTGESADGIGGVHGDGYYSNRFGDHQVVLFASGDYSKGAPAFLNYQPSSTDRNRGYQVVQEGFKYAWSPSAATRLSATVLHTDANLDYPQAYQDNHIMNDRHEDLVTLKLDKDFNDKVSVYLKGYYHGWHTVFWSVTNDPPLGSGTSVDREPWNYEDEGLNALARFRLNRGLEYYLGYDLQRYKGFDSEYHIDPSSGVAHGVFGQIRTTHDLIQNGEFALGARWTGESTSGSGVSGSSSTWIWNASGQYDFNRYLFVRGSLGTTFRLPTAEELFVNVQDDELGNPRLKPESGRGVNLSVGGALGRANWELTGFSRHISNLIACDGTPADPAYDCQFINEDKVKTEGVEFSLNGELAPGWTGQASYTLSNSKNEGSRQQISRVPKQSAKASLDWTPPGSAVGAVVSVNWTGDIYTPISVSAPTLLANGTLATGSFTYNYGNFTLVNLAAHYNFGADRSLRLNVALENVFNTHYGRPSVGPLDAPVTVGGTAASRFLILPYGNPRTFRVGVTKSF